MEGYIAEEKKPHERLFGISITQPDGSGAPMDKKTFQQLSDIIRKLYDEQGLELVIGYKKEDYWSSL